MRTLKLQFNYLLTRNITQSDIRKSRAVRGVGFDSDHRPVLSLKIRFHKRNRGMPPQPKIDMAHLEDEECRTNFRNRQASTYNSVCDGRSTDDFNQKKRLRRKLCRQPQQDCDKEWTSGAKKLEKASPKYAINEEIVTEFEVLVCIQKMNDGKSGRDDGISAEMLKYLPSSGIREMTRSSVQYG
ncbi:hypothetical protein RB195_005744 [Necator americanus]|uniref:Uncharacterized protein n=1 Tax=Necator americanus TaxID=51031 RepID=A0ABR1BSA5_NECAM